MCLGDWRLRRDGFACRVAPAIKGLAAFERPKEKPKPAEAKKPDEAADKKEEKKKLRLAVKCDLCAGRAAALQRARHRGRDIE